MLKLVQFPGFTIFLLVIIIIDAFCSIIATEDGYLQKGSFIYIGVFCQLLANIGIELKDFSGLLHSVKVYIKTDDYTGNFLDEDTSTFK